jgi:hypothetical protein
MLYVIEGRLIIRRGRFVCTEDKEVEGTSWYADGMKA